MEFGHMAGYGTGEPSDGSGKTLDDYLAISGDFSRWIKNR